MTKWLVSYRFRPRMRHTPGDRMQAMRESTDTIEIWGEHPAKVLAAKRRQIAEEDDDGASHGVDEWRGVDQIECIYSAIEIPDGTLSGEDEDWLR